MSSIGLTAIEARFEEVGTSIDTTGGRATGKGESLLEAREEGIFSLGADEALL